MFRPQSGDNLLIVGQRAEGAAGMLAAALVSLATQHRPYGLAVASEKAALASGYAAGSEA